MVDIVTRLRGANQPQICHLAAKEIERLRSRALELKCEIDQSDLRISRQAELIQEFKSRCSVVEVMLLQLTDRVAQLEAQNAELDKQLDEARLELPDMVAKVARDNSQMRQRLAALDIAIEQLNTARTLNPQK